MEGGQPRKRPGRPWRDPAWAAVGLAVCALIAAVALVAGRGGTSARAEHHLRRAGPASTPTDHAASPRLSASAIALARIDALGLIRATALAQLGLPIFCGGPVGDEVAFTFDDGPGPYTYLALRKLAQAHDRATFFVVGRSMIHFPGWVQREVAVAAIGDHTYQHLYLPELSSAEVRYQLTETARAIERATGRRPVFFRPPYGAHDARVDAIVRRLGLLEVLWSTDSRDSLGANGQGIIRNVKAGLHPGAIILMHENRGQTIRALTTLLPYLQRRHLHSVSLLELLATDPPSVTRIRHGEAACGTSGPLTSG